MRLIIEIALMRFNKQDKGGCIKKGAAPFAICSLYVMPFYRIESKNMFNHLHLPKIIMLPLQYCTMERQQYADKNRIWNIGCSNCLYIDSH